jgi:hypothetical protein
MKRFCYFTLILLLSFFDLLDCFLLNKTTISHENSLKDNLLLELIKLSSLLPAGTAALAVVAGSTVHCDACVADMRVAPNSVAVAAVVGDAFAADFAAAVAASHCAYFPCAN